MLKTAAVIKHFGSVEAVAEHFDISVQAVYQWGGEVPELRELQLVRDFPDVFGNQGRRQKTANVPESVGG